MSPTRVRSLTSLIVKPNTVRKVVLFLFYKIQDEVKLKKLYLSVLQIKSSKQIGVTL